MKVGLWTGFFLLEEKGSDNLHTVVTAVQRIKTAGFCCGELDERNAFNLFVDCTDKECVAHAEVLGELDFFTQLHAPKPVADIDAQKLMEKRMIRACSIMNIKTVVTHPFLTEAGRIEPKAESLEFLNRFCDQAGYEGIRIALENQIYPVDMDFYLAQIPTLGVNIDFAHAVASGSDVSDMIVKYGPRLYGLHVADSDGRSTDYHIMPGRGIVNWPEVFGKLEAVHYMGDLHLETVHERSTCPEINDKTAAVIYKTVTELMGACNI